MPALALVDVLQDFGASARQPSRATERVPAPKPEEPHPPALAPGLQPDRIAQAVAQAEAALAERLNAEHAEAIAARESRHAAEIQQMQTEFGEHVGRLVGARLAELESRVVGLTSSVVARILGVALSDDVKQGAIDELGRSIIAAIGDREAVRIRVRGPVSLYEALKPGLGRFAERVEFGEAAGFDLTVSVDNTLFETRMAEWSAALSEVLA